MDKIKITTETFNILKETVYKTFEDIVRNAKEVNSISSSLQHISISETGLQPYLVFLMHNRSFQVIPKYDLIGKTVNLQTFEVVPDYNNISNNKLVNVWGTDFIINTKGLKENTTQDSIGEEYFNVLIEGLYPDKK